MAVTDFHYTGATGPLKFVENRRCLGWYGKGMNEIRVERG